MKCWVYLELNEKLERKYEKTINFEKLLISDTIDMYTGRDPDDGKLFFCSEEKSAVVELLSGLKTAISHVENRVNEIRIDD